MAPTAPSASASSFSPALFTFVRDLRANNDRDWFKANRRRYDEAVLERRSRSSRISCRTCTR